VIEEGFVSQPRPAGNLLASAKTFVATLIAIIGTRLEIAAGELEEERLRLSGIVAYAALVFLFLALGLIFLSLLVVAVFWDEHRIAALTGIVIVYTLLAIIAGIQLRKQLSQKSRLFSITVDELRKDQERLQS
jgi:uncharacterized membrane protein YqjE